MPSPKSNSIRSAEQNTSPEPPPGQTLVVLGTGGTIAGTAAHAADTLGYASAQLGVLELLSRIPGFAGRNVESEQVAQIDSKDMNNATWLRLAQRTAHHLARDEVGGVVITHGTDTLEETAYFLHRVLTCDLPRASHNAPSNAQAANVPGLLQPTKPVVLTAAMRPATSLQADGPQNLADALTLAQDPHAKGVLVTMAGRVHLGARVRKQHSYALDALDSGDSGPVAMIENSVVRWLWPTGTDSDAAAAAEYADRGVDLATEPPGDGASDVQSDAQSDLLPIALKQLPTNPADWPRVFVLLSHAGADGALVRALCAAGAQGLIVAGTGNGTIHVSLESALREASSTGVVVWRTTRCARGAVLPHAGDLWPSAGALSPAQARIALMLHLMR